MAVHNIDDAGLAQEQSGKGLSIIKFYADWCGSCRLIAPKYKRLSEEERFQEVRFLETNAEKNPAVRKWAGVTSLPFFAAVKDGNIIVADCAGKEEKIMDMLNKLKEA